MSNTDVVIVGSGPHSLAVAKSLVDRGHDVVVLDREASMDSRRQTMLIQPGGMKVLYDLGALRAIEEQVGKLEGYDYYFERERVAELRYRDLPDCPFPYALGVPYRVMQKALLATLAGRPGFTLIGGAKLKELPRDGSGHFGEVVAERDGREIVVRGKVVVGGDGADSVVRALAGIPVRQKTWDYDAVTFRVPRPDGWRSVLSNYRGRGNRYVGVGAYDDEEISILVGVKRDGFEELKGRGLDALFAMLEELEPRLRCARDAVKSWDDVSVQKFRGLVADTWVEDGLVLIGSSAHSLTTFGGQNMNLALYDAVDAASVIHEALRDGRRRAEDLKPYEQRRRPLVEAIARFQDAVAAPETAGGGAKPDLAAMKERLQASFRSMALGPLAARPAAPRSAPPSPTRIYQFGFAYDEALNWIWDQLPKGDAVMAKMGREAAEKRLNVIGPLSGRLLHALTRMIRGKRVFEFGSSIGYSTIWFARAVGPGGKVYYTDRDPAVAERAREYAREAGVEDRIELLVGDALESFARTEGDFDVILCDADKQLYPEILRRSIPRLREGGLFLADNVFWHGEMFGDGAGDLVTPLRDALRSMLADASLLTNVVAVGDGLAVAIKQ